MKLCFKGLKSDSVGNLNVKSISIHENIKCWQRSHPGQPHASTTSPLSPTLTLLSVYVRAGPVFSVKGTFNVSFSPHLWAVLCYFASYHYVLLQCQHSKCHSASWLLIFLLWWHHACTTSPRRLLCSAFVPSLHTFCTKLDFIKNKKVHMSKCTFLIWSTREKPKHSVEHVGSTENKFDLPWYNLLE